jgi:hypothetical protein
MGNTPDEPELRRIGHNGQPLLKVNGTVYGMWAFSASQGSLWRASADFEEGAREQRAAGAEVLATTADEVAREVAICIPMMIASGCAFLDPVE